LKKTRILAASAFAMVLGLGVTLYATEEHPSDLFKQYCARCHGEDGKAQTPKGKQLMAQDFNDADWQAEETDEELIEIVTKGGEDMPPFGKKLKKEQIESLVKKDVRGFGKRR
jgi:mono/diheme cytochrome c family protein